MIEVINTEFYPLFCLTKDGGDELNFEVIFWNTIMILKGAAYISSREKLRETKTAGQFMITVLPHRSRFFLRIGRLSL